MSTAARLGSPFSFGLRSGSDMGAYCWTCGQAGRLKIGEMLQIAVFIEDERDRYCASQAVNPMNDRDAGMIVS